jgi:hypothetical protein
MDINTGAQQDRRYTAARFSEKGCLQACGGDALIWHNVMVHNKNSVRCQDSRPL